MSVASATEQLDQYLAGGPRRAGGDAQPAALQARRRARSATSSTSRRSRRSAQRFGLKLVFAGNGRHRARGRPGQDWDMVAIVEYPSRQAFVDMVRSPEYRAVRASPRRGAGRGDPAADAGAAAMTPLVLVHGNPEIDVIWDPLAPQLEREAIRLSPPGSARRCRRASSRRRRRTALARGRAGGDRRAGRPRRPRLGRRRTSSTWR